MVENGDTVPGGEGRGGLCFPADYRVWWSVLSYPSWVQGRASADSGFGTF